MKRILSPHLLGAILTILSAATSIPAVASLPNAYRHAAETSPTAPEGEDDEMKPTLIDGLIVDAFTYQAVRPADSVEVTLLTQDSTVVQRVRCRGGKNNMGEETAYFAMRLPR